MEKTEEKLPHWELDSLYPGLDSESYEQALRQLVSSVDELEKYLAEQAAIQTEPSEPSQVIDSRITHTVEGYLRRVNDLLRLNATLRLYVWCIVDTDSSNELAGRRLSELNRYNVRISNLATQFQIWLGKHRKLLPEVLAASQAAQAHALYLQETADQSRFLMSRPEESLASELALSGLNAWSKLHGDIWSQLEVPFAQNGKVEKIALTLIQNMARNDPDGTVRRRAAEAEVTAWASMREPLTAAINGVVGSKVTLNKRRGRTSLAAALDQSRIDQVVLDALLDSIRGFLPVFWKYFRAKAHALGKEKLAWWDLYAPMGKADRRYTFEEAETLVLAQFSRFNPRLSDFAQSVFDRNWIDAEPRAGKQGGAYCNGVPGAGITRILCNFDGSLMEVLSLAHELGHAFHVHCQQGRTYYQCVTPMTLAESASLLCETLVSDQAFAEAGSPQEKLAIADAFLGTAVANLIGSTASFYWEKEVFERRENGELSCDELCDLSMKYDQEICGDALDGDHLHPYMWATWSHNFMSNISFYKFPYSFGMLFSLGLYAQYLQRGAAFIPDYETMLASTGEARPAELAARFGIDLRDQKYWLESLGLVEKRIERFIELCG